MTTIITSGEEPISATESDWVDVLIVPGTSVVNYIVLVNEGDWPGWWRLVQGENDVEETPPARLYSGAGESGERQAGLTISCPGFSGGRLQIRKGLLGGDLTGIFATGMK